MVHQLLIDPNRPPKVLLLGNGILLLNKGIGWDDLLKKLCPDEKCMPDLTKIPAAMKPEAICGTNVEETQTLIALNLRSQTPHELLKQLVFMDFDAVITTNYTYEIEDALFEGKWSEYKRKKCHTTLYGSTQAKHNIFKCNLIKTKEGRTVPVFHVHGELARKKSLILSYYSYAKSINLLVDMSKRRNNVYEEHQQTGKELVCEGWLDYFILGDVYALGFGFDLSEFDIWWALERKNRENANTGKMHAYMISKQIENEKSVMLRAMGAEEKFISVKDDYDEAYINAIKQIKESLTYHHMEPSDTHRC